MIIIPHSSVFLSHPRDPQRQMVFAANNLHKLIYFDRILVFILLYLIGFMSCMRCFGCLMLPRLLYQTDFMLCTC